MDSPAYDFSLPTRASQFRSDLRLVRENLAHIFGLRASNFVLLRSAGFVLAASGLILISAIIEVSLALPMAWYFHRTTTMSLPANVLVIPLATILMPAAVLAVGVSYISYWLAHVPALLAGYCLAVLTGTIRFIGRWQIADVRLASTTLATACVAAIAYGMALILARRRLPLAWLGVVGLLASAIWITFAPPTKQWRPGALEFTANDVGQGDSLLI